MFDVLTIRSTDIHLRYAVAGALIVLMLAAFALPAAADHTAETSFASFSGDDAYDPAAGGSPALLAVTDYVAAGRTFDRALAGDAAYDPAAGGLPALAIFQVAGYDMAARAFDSSLSGDAAYDAAAGGLSAFVAECDVAQLGVAGGYSGNDAYDLAAGGNPDGLAGALACVPAGVLGQ
ncbi:MAG: hypothetical protein PVG11_03365 [Anaerolineae bacterium]|jgi:hypothetical protein